MKRVHVRKMARRRAFTLLEVLMVIVILGVLASLIAPRLMGSGEKAKVNATKLQLKSIEDQLERFKIECGRYPSQDEGLAALVSQPAAEDLTDKWAGPYIKEAAVDPWGSPLQFKVPGQYNADGVDLWSFGPDKSDGTEDDIKNWKQS